jgi:hypothetical protein
LGEASNQLLKLPRILVVVKVAGLKLVDDLIMVLPSLVGSMRLLRIDDIDIRITVACQQTRAMAKCRDHLLEDQALA